MKKNNFIKYFKDKIFIKTSEELLDISVLPEQQCIRIDKIQKEIRSCIEDINDFCQVLTNIEGAESLATDIKFFKYRLDDRNDELENLRKEVELLRKWGQDWKDLSKTLLGKIESEDDFFEYLSNECQIKYNEIFCL